MTQEPAVEIIAVTGREEYPPVCRRCGIMALKIHVERGDRVTHWVCTLCGTIHMERRGNEDDGNRSA